jgi:parallel beta-helix repeat protein
VSVLGPGDTLLVKPGTYGESNIDSIPAGTSWSAPVTVKAYDPSNRPILRPPSGADKVLLFESPQQYIIIDGFVADASNVLSNGIKLTTGATHIRIQNTEVMNSPGVGILLTDGANFNEFINIDTHGARDLAGSGGTYNHGIYIATSDNLLDHVRSYSNTGYGIHVYNDGGGVSRNVVRNSVAHDNGLSGRGSGIIVGSGDSNQVYNCVAYNNKDNGMYVQYSSPQNTVFYNNTAYGNGGAGLLIGSDAGGTIVKNNLSYGNGTDLSDGGSGTTLSNNLTGVNPGFVNPSAADFHLTSGSRAIDAGTSVSMVATDADGVSRPQGAGYDVGAFEYRSGGTTTAPAAPTNLRIR